MKYDAQALLVLFSVSPSPCIYDYLSTFFPFLFVQQKICYDLWHI